MNKISKRQRIIDYFLRYPDASVKKVAEKFEIAVSNVYPLRKAAQQQAEMLSDTPAAEEAVSGVEVIRELQAVIQKKGTARGRQVGGDHYLNAGIQPWDVVDTWPRDQRIGYYRGGALKYLMRMGSKDQSEMEVAKGQHYLQKLLEIMTQAPAE